MLKVIDESPNKRTIVLQPREQSYGGALLLVIVPGYVVAGLMGLAQLLNLLLRFPVDWLQFGFALMLAAVAAMCAEHAKSLPVEERSLVLEPGQVSLVKERLSRPHFNVLNREVEICELGPDVGVVVSNRTDDGDPSGIEIWGASTVMHVRQLSMKEAQRLCWEVESWLEQRSVENTPTSGSNREASSEICQQSVDADESSAFMNRLAESKWVSIEQCHEGDAVYLIRLRPGGPEVVGLGLAAIGFSLLAGFLLWGAMTAESGNDVLGTFCGISSFGALMLIVVAVKSGFEQVELKVSPHALEMTSDFLGWVRRRSLTINAQTQVGFVVRNSNGDSSIPTICVRSGGRSIEFGTWLSRDDKAQLLKLLREYWQLNRWSNRFI